MTLTEMFQRVPEGLDSHFHPLGEQLMVVQLEQGQRVDQRIVQPDAHRDPPQVGLVIDIGDGIPTEAWSELRPTNPDVPGSGKVEVQAQRPIVRPGDLILYGRYAGINFELENGTPALLMRITEVLACEPFEARQAFNAHLVVHATITRGIAIHRPNVVCTHCPTPALDEAKAEHQAAIAADLHVLTHDIIEHDAKPPAPSPGPTGPAPVGDANWAAWQRARTEDVPSSEFMGWGDDVERCGARLNGFAHPCERPPDHPGPHAVWSNDQGPASWVWDDAPATAPEPVPEVVDDTPNF